MKAVVHGPADVSWVAVGPGITEAPMLDCPGLAQVRRSVTGGTTLTSIARESGESWYVISGRGALDSASLFPGKAVWLPGGTRYRCRADEDLELLAVTIRTGSPVGAVLARALADCQPERTGDREFRVLLGVPGDGLTITEFVGLIPPGRAPSHQHTYNEVVHVLAGTGVVHLGAVDTPLGPGTSVYLPPGQPHCLENTGTTPLMVLGVFHPSGSPAAKRA